MNVGFKFFLISCFFSLSSWAAGNPCFPEMKSSFSKAQQLLDGSQNLLASQQYNLIATLACRPEDQATANLGAARAYYRLNENPLADETIQDLNRLKEFPEIQKKARLLQAWYQPSFRQRLPEPEKAKFEEFVQAESTYRQTHEMKKPWVAGTLSAVLPGAGQVYNGNYQAAAMSFVLNALFLSAALELNRKDLPTTSLAAGLVFSITYAGNIFGSIHSAQQINSSFQEPGVEEIRQKILPEVEP